MEFKQQLGEILVQAITFLLFFWIMAKFAWPVLKNLLDERQRQIEDAFADIDRQKRETESLHRDYEAKLREIEQEARARIQEAIAEGRRVANEVTEKARQEAHDITERAQRNVQLEIAKARVQLREDIVNLTLGATERLMREKLDQSTHHRLVSDFVKELETKN